MMVTADRLIDQSDVNTSVTVEFKVCFHSRRLDFSALIHTASTSTKELLMLHSNKFGFVNLSSSLSCVQTKQPNVCLHKEHSIDA